MQTLAPTTTAGCFSGLFLIHCFELFTYSWWSTISNFPSLLLSTTCILQKFVDPAMLPITSDSFDSSSTSTIFTAPFFLLLHASLKWPSFPQLPHSLSQAGQVSFLNFMGAREPWPFLLQKPQVSLSTPSPLLVTGRLCLTPLLYSDILLVFEDLFRILESAFPSSLASISLTVVSRSILAPSSVAA